jgi:hypothetical protein
MVLALLVSIAVGNASGAIGYSGAPGRGTCNDCHSGGTPPTVTFSGPQTIAAGATASYSITVTGGNKVGVDVSSSDMYSTLNALSANAGVSFGELHHVSPQPSGSTFQFSLSASSFVSTVTLYAAGNAVNGDGNTSGDRAATATYAITVTPGSGMDPPLIVTPAASSDSPVTGRSTTVTVGAMDDGGEANLSYTWSATGPGPVTFTPNGSNAAKMATATFATAGSYMITCTVRDGTNKTATSSFPVTVAATFSALYLTPYSVQVPLNGMQQFTAVAKDQFGVSISPQPAVDYSVPIGGGTISATGLLHAQGGAGGDFIVQAVAGSISTASTFSVGQPLMGSGDTTPPSVTLTAPQSGQPLALGLALEAVATDDVGVDHVLFTVADIPIAIASAAPWRTTYASVASGLPTGEQLLAAVAFDLAGNQTKSSSVVVIVPGAAAPDAGAVPDAGTPDGGTTSPMAGSCGCTSTDALAAVLALLVLLRPRRALSPPAS